MTIFTKLELTKPAFIKPSVPTFTIKGETFDISKEIPLDDIAKLTAGMSVKHFKEFYDNLSKSMEEYSNAINTNILMPLSSSINGIGTRTNEIELSIQSIQESIPEIAG